MRLALYFLIGFFVLTVLVGLARAQEPACKTADDVRTEIDGNMRGKNISGEFYLVSMMDGKSLAMVVAMKGRNVLTPILFIPFNERGCQEGNALAFDAKNYKDFVEGIKDPRKDLVKSFTLRRIGGQSADI